VSVRRAIRPASDVCIIPDVVIVVRLPLNATASQALTSIHAHHRSRDM
jgi:hypothetical protein